MTLRRHALATLFAVASHGALLFSLSRLRAGPPLGSTDTTLVIDFSEPIMQMRPAETLPPPPAQPRTPTLPANRAHGRAMVKSQTTASLTAPPRMPQGQESAEPAADPPLDLTGDTLLIAAHGESLGSSTAGGNGAGTASDFARGQGRRPGGPAMDGNGEGLDHASAVSLPEQSWSCPWPPEAEAERIDEQTVIIRVVVNADGSAASAEMLEDPGHGFGRAAVACALHTRFTPARDRKGRPVRAVSPPIRVRFTR